MLMLCDVVVATLLLDIRERWSEFNPSWDST